jgi:hypothetical protein
VPHKHYGKEEIENVIDEVSTPMDITSEDYPCELTMKRWKAWFSRNKTNVEGILQSVIYRLERLHLSLNAPISLLKHLREIGSGWLGTITRFVINSGNRLCT